MFTTDACRAPRPPSERGSVTLETAIAIPVLLAVAMIGVWCIAVAVGAVRVHDAARSAARSLARGDSLSQARELAHQTAPAAAFECDFSEDAVRVTAKERVAASLPLLSSVGITIERTVVAPLEHSPR